MPRHQTADQPTLRPLRKVKWALIVAGCALLVTIGVHALNTFVFPAENPIPIDVELLWAGTGMSILTALVSYAVKEWN